MNQLKTKETWTGIIFLAALALGVCMFLYGLLPRYLDLGMVRPNRLPRQTMQTAPSLGVRFTGRILPQEPTPFLTRVTELIAAAEPAVNKTVDQAHPFIQIYGAAQGLIGRRVVEDQAQTQYTVVKLEDGVLGFVGNGPSETERHTKNLGRLQHVLAAEDIPLLYIQAPAKVAADGASLPYGMSDNADEVADDLLWQLAELGVETLDLREDFRASDADWSDWFFRTDHHWTPEAAFFSYQILCDKIETYNQVMRTKNGARTMHYSVPARYRDPAQFTRTVYEDYFLGSQGKRVGAVYGGTDDITLWRPKFPTKFRYLVPIHNMTREGRFEESLLFKERVDEVDWFNGNPYTLYAGGDYPIAYATNLLNPTGPRIMLLRDSFACVLTPFLALACSELITVDLRYFSGDLMHYIEWRNPDLVFVMYTTGSTRIDRLFDFFTMPTDRLSFPQSKAVAPTVYALPALKEEEIKEPWRKR